MIPRHRKSTTGVCDTCKIPTINAIRMLMYRFNGVDYFYNLCGQCTKAKWEKQYKESNKMNLYSYRGNLPCKHGEHIFCEPCLNEMVEKSNEAVKKYERFLSKPVEKPL
jgi:hypothetical protein